MHLARSIHVIGVHAEGEIGNVVTGGVLSYPGRTMVDKLHNLKAKGNDSLRHFLLQEPRGVVNNCTNLITPPATDDGDFGLLIMEADDYAAMSGSNTICTTTAVIETGLFPMREGVMELRIDTAAGRVVSRATCSSGKVQRVDFDNVPCFVDILDLPVDVPGLGQIKVDVAWGGMWYAFARIEDVRVEFHSDNGAELVNLGEAIKKAVRQTYEPVHPEQPTFRGIECLTIVTPLLKDEDGLISASNATIVSPGRIDRSPCGTATSARLAVSHARGQLRTGQKFVHKSVIDTKFVAMVKQETKVGQRAAIIPTIGGRAWITGFHQYVLDPTDPFPTGFRCGDVWPKTRREAVV